MWKNRRRTVALLGGAATLLLPFLEIRGRSAVRFDLPTLSLHLFGAVVPIDEFYLVLLGALFLVALTLWVAVVGTRFCKTVCPYAMLQNVLADRETLAVAYDPAPRGNVYRYSVRNDTDRPVVLALSVEGPARLVDDPEVAIPSRGRVSGKVTVQGGDGTPGEILITAAGRGFRIVRKAAFP